MKPVRIAVGGWFASVEAVDHGVVVGTRIDTQPSRFRAFRWDAASGLQWLTGTDEQSLARAVNASAQIVGAADGHAAILVATGDT
jgi:hypothetical protein